MWRPWRRDRSAAMAETTRAMEALSRAQENVPHVEALARDLERIAEQNHLAPRIAEAFRAAAPRKNGP